MKKFLCMCQGGNVRSVAMAYALKHAVQRQDALACGWSTNTSDTRDMLCKWADYIVIMQKEFLQFVPAQFHDKVRVVDVGPDVFGTPMHPDLQGFVTSVAREWEGRQFEI